MANDEHGKHDTIIKVSNVWTPARHPERKSEMSVTIKAPNVTNAMLFLKQIARDLDMRDSEKDGISAHAQGNKRQPQG